jgi:hypothetical protein
MPMGKAKDNVLWIVVCIITFFLGVFIANIKSLQYFVIDEKVDIVAATSIIATFIIAWYVGTILEKRNQGNRTQKELILKRTEDAFKVVEEFMIKVNTGTISLQEAASVFKRINVAVTRINEALRYAALPSDASLNTNIVTDSRALKDLLTDTPRTGSSANSSLQVQNGIVTISPDRMIEIESKCDSLKQNILFFQLFINKC